MNLELTVVSTSKETREFDNRYFKNMIDTLKHFSVNNHSEEILNNRSCHQIRLGGLTI